MSKIVAFAGFAGSGKSTAANLFTAAGWKRVAFGDILKDVVCLLFSLDRVLLEGDTPESRAWRDTEIVKWTDKLELVEDREITPRILLQIIGEHLRQWNPYVWTDAAEARIEQYLADGQNVVVSDLRHISEWRMLRRLGATCVGIQCGKVPKWVPHFLKHMEEEMPEGAAHLLTSLNGDDRSLLEWGAKCRSLRENGRTVHTSEWQHLLLPLDLVINNNRSIAALHKKLRPLL